MLSAVCSRETLPRKKALPGRNARQEKAAGLEAAGDPTSVRAMSWGTGSWDAGQSFPTTGS